MDVIEIIGAAPGRSQRRSRTSWASGRLTQPAVLCAVLTWRNQIVTILEHNKRYPSQARARGEQGVTRLAFRIDGEGHLLSSRIVASSGSAALDAETLALVQRAQPYPPPPSELAGSELTVPVSFNIR